MSSVFSPPPPIPSTPLPLVIKLYFHFYASSSFLPSYFLSLWEKFPFIFEQFLPISQYLLYILVVIYISSFSHQSDIYMYMSDLFLLKEYGVKIHVFNNKYLKLILYC